MDNLFFEKPILNSPYEYPGRHWELDSQGQSTQKIIESRRQAAYITPIPKPKKQKGSSRQQQLIIDEGKGLSTEQQQYDPTPIINITNYHAFKLRERLEISKGGRSLLQGRGEPINTLEIRI